MQNTTQNHKTLQKSFKISLTIEKVRFLVRVFPDSYWDVQPRPRAATRPPRTAVDGRVRVLVVVRVDLAHVD